MNIRVSYLDARLGWSIISPIIGLFNFVMLFYITIKTNTTLQFIPINILMPIFIISFLIVIVISGTTFRKKQLKIDSNLNYEQQTEPARTTRIIFDDLHLIQKMLSIPISQESINRRQYMYDIESGKYG